MRSESRLTPTVVEFTAKQSWSFIETILPRLSCWYARSRFSCTSYFFLEPSSLFCCISWEYTAVKNVSKSYWPFVCIARKELSCICYYCLLLNSALILYLVLLWPHISGMTLCWTFNPHWLTVVCFYVFIVDVDRWNNKDINSSSSSRSSSCSDQCFLFKFNFSYSYSFIPAFLS